jgi:hypothetical protein
MVVEKPQAQPGVSAEAGLMVVENPQAQPGVSADAPQAASRR